MNTDQESEIYHAVFLAFIVMIGSSSYEWRV